MPAPSLRGEALCSVSFVSHMTVTTMTGDEPHGWRVTYKVYSHWVCLR